MVNEKDCNSVAITSLLKRDFSDIASQIASVCWKAGVELMTIENSKDYWCRDFMPVQVNTNRYIQFTYDPSYYKHRKYRHLWTDTSALRLPFSAYIERSDIILDGGNIAYYEKVAIMTDRVFMDNPQYKKDDLLQELSRLLELDQILIIPTLPYDTTGHADGMVRFVNSDTLLLNDFRLISGNQYWQKLLSALKQFELILLPNDLHLNTEMDDATGDYINMAIIKDHLLVPEYRRPTDRLAHQIIRLAFPGCNIVPVRVNELAVKAGVLHCATWSNSKG